MAIDPKLDKIVADAIPLTMNCEVKRSAEIRRRAALKMKIKELLWERDREQPYSPKMEYK